MKSRLLSIALLALVFVASAAAEELENQIGVGVNVLSTVHAVTYWHNFYGPTYSAQFTDIYLPIRFGARTRIEPEVALGVSFDGSDTDWAYRLRMGLFRADRLGESFVSSFGLRAGIMYINDFSLSAALCLGGEHFFSPHLSLGGEARLDYCNNRGDYHTIVTDGLVILRWYVPVSNQD